MNFYPEKPLRLVSVRTHEKNGKDLTFIKLADELTYENNEFMLTRDADPKRLEIGKPYDVELNVEGRYSIVRLSPVSVK